MSGLIRSFLILAIFLTGCAIDPIVEEPSTSFYSGEYCEYRDLGDTFIKDCLLIEMSFVDQKVYYTMFPDSNSDSIICAANTSYLLEDSIYFDSAATVFSFDYLTKIYFSGGYEIRISDDSLFFHRYDYRSGIGCYVNMKRLD